MGHLQLLLCAAVGKGIRPVCEVSVDLRAVVVLPTGCAGEARASTTMQEARAGVRGYSGAAVSPSCQDPRLWEGGRWILASWLK